MYYLNILPIGILLWLIYVLMDILIRVIKKPSFSWIHRLIFYTFLLYALYVFHLISGYIKIPPVSTISIFQAPTFLMQLQPFLFASELLSIYRRQGMSWWFFNTFRLAFFNLIMLLPLGIYFPVLYKIKTLKKVALYTFLTSLTIEVYQVIFTVLGFLNYRRFNVDDLFLNTVGGIIGYGLYVLLLKPWIHKLLKND